MTIRSVDSLGASRVPAPAPTAPVDRAAPAGPEGPAAAPARDARVRQDSVAISDAGRALAGGAAEGAGGLSAERLTELRRKVLEGAYNQSAVVDQVARRLLSSGDL